MTRVGRQLGIEALINEVLSIAEKVVDGEDLAILMSKWGSTAPADQIDGVGKVDGGDLGELLGAWGPCPEATPQGQSAEPPAKSRDDDRSALQRLANRRR